MSTPEETGPCCACGQTKTSARNIMMLDHKAPVPGTGWGCIVCRLPMDGAYAVLCDHCLEHDAILQWAVVGYLADKERIPIAELSGTHEHNRRFHPELAENN